MTFTVLLKREIKLFLKNPAFIISLVVLLGVYLMLGGIMGLSVRETQTIIVESRVGVVLGENNEFIKTLLVLLNQTLGGRVYVYSSVEDALRERDICLVIPSGFTGNVTSNTTAFIDSIVVINTLSLMSVQAKLALPMQLASVIEQIVPIAAASVYGYQVNPRVTVSIGKQVAYTSGREISASTLMSLVNMASFLPFIVGLVLSINIGYAAQLVAYEKAEKAFEMLLAQPIKRSRIVIAKIIGAALATIIYSVVYIGGLMAMTVMIAGNSSGAIISSNLPGTSVTGDLGANIYYQAGVSTLIAIILGLFQSAALGIILGSLSQDERTAGILATPITLIYLGIAFATLFLGFTSSLISAIVAGLITIPIPAIHTFSLITGETIYTVIALTVNILVTLVLVIIAVVLFNRDIAILGLKIGFKRRVER